MQGHARYFGFQTATLSAVAEHFVIETWEVAQFARKARLTCVEFAIEDKSAANAPAKIHENNVFLALNHAFGHFAIRHRARVVINVHTASNLLGHDVYQGALIKIEATEAVSHLWVHASRHIHADVQYAFLGYIQLFDEVDDIAT